MNQLKSNIEEEYSKKISTLIQHKKKNLQQLKYLEQFKKEIKDDLKDHNPVEILQNTDQYLKSFNFLKNKSLKELNHNFISSFNNDKLLDKTLLHFKVQKFTKCKEKNKIIYSDPIEQNGNTWRLKVYPNGAGIYKEIYLSVFVELLKCNHDGGSYKYKIIMYKNSNRNQFVEKEYISCFQSAVCWGYNRFYKIEDLERNKFISPQNDSLNLTLEISPSNYIQLIKDNKLFIESLKKNLNEKDEEIESLKKQVLKLKKQSLKCKKKNLKILSQKEIRIRKKRKNKFGSLIFNSSKKNKKKDPVGIEDFKINIFDDKDLSNLYKKPLSKEFSPLYKKRSRFKSFGSVKFSNNFKSQKNSSRICLGNSYDKKRIRKASFLDK